MRLDKFLVDCGLGSRSEVKNFLKAGRVQVAGRIEKSPKRQINEKEDRVSFDGQILRHETFVYYVLNKPQGVISATEDDRHQTVLDLLDDYARSKEVFPVGRLDRDTEGLLLLTNNGKLAHAMLSPKKHVLKIYQAKVAGLMTEDDQKRFAAGIDFKDFRSLPAELIILSKDELKQESLVQVQIAEGKFHQVKRMVAACGKEVLSLKRLSMGPLHLDEQLALGDYRRLNPSELGSLEIFGVEL